MKAFTIKFRRSLISDTQDQISLAAAQIGITEKDMVRRVRNEVCKSLAPPSRALPPPSSVLPPL